MGEPTVIMYNKPRPGPKPLDARSLWMVCPLGREDRAFLIAYRDAPAHDTADIERAKGILRWVLPVRREALDSDSNLSVAMEFALHPPLRPADEPPPRVFMNREGGTDRPSLVRPLQSHESRFLAALSVAPGCTVEEAERAKTLLAEVLGVPRAQLECPRAYFLAMDSVLQLA